MPGMADALALSRMTHAFALMEWVGNVVRERALLEDPLAVGSKHGHGYEQERDEYFPIHKIKTSPKLTEEQRQTRQRLLWPPVHARRRSRELFLRCSSG